MFLEWSAPNENDTANLPAGPAAGYIVRVATFSAPQRPTDVLFARLRDGDPVPHISAGLRAAVLDDLRYWQAGAVVVALSRTMRRCAWP